MPCRFRLLATPGGAWLAGPVVTLSDSRGFGMSGGQADLSRSGWPITLLTDQGATQAAVVERL
jgi:hypothetical protein